MKHNEFQTGGMNNTLESRKSNFQKSNSPLKSVGSESNVIFSSKIGRSRSEHNTIDVSAVMNEVGEENGLDYELDYSSGGSPDAESDINDNFNENDEDNDILYHGQGDDKDDYYSSRNRHLASQDPNSTSEMDLNKYKQSMANSRNNENYSFFTDNELENLSMNLRDHDHDHDHDRENLSNINEFSQMNTNVQMQIQIQMTDYQEKLKQRILLLEEENNMIREELTKVLKDKKTLGEEETSHLRILLNYMSSISQKTDVVVVAGSTNSQNFMSPAMKNGSNSKTTNNYEMNSNPEMFSPSSNGSPTPNAINGKLQSSGFKKTFSMPALLQNSQQQQQQQQDLQQINVNLAVPPFNSNFASPTNATNPTDRNTKKGLSLEFSPNSSGNDIIDMNDDFSNLSVSLSPTTPNSLSTALDTHKQAKERLKYKHRRNRKESFSSSISSTSSHDAHHHSASTSLSSPTSLRFDEIILCGGLKVKNCSFKSSAFASASAFKSTSTFGGFEKKWVSLHATKIKIFQSLASLQSEQILISQIMMEEAEELKKIPKYQSLFENEDPNLCISLRFNPPKNEGGKGMENEEEMDENDKEIQEKLEKLEKLEKENEEKNKISQEIGTEHGNDPSQQEAKEQQRWILLFTSSSEKFEWKNCLNQVLLKK